MVDLEDTGKMDAVSAALRDEARVRAPRAVTVAAASAALSACGGGGGGEDVGASGASQVAAGAQDGVAPTAQEASRFLAQASMGATRAGINRVRELGYAGWLDAQFDAAPSMSRWEWMVANGFTAEASRNGTAGLDAALWCKLIDSSDTLRQRVTLALSEIFVASISGMQDPWRNFASAAHMDLLESHAFGDLRSLLQAISLSPAMGMFLTFRGSAKANPTTGALPDENYARELLQLFTIGLVQLQTDGTPRLEGGQPVETYGAADIGGLARVFTGWDNDLAGLSGAAATATPDYRRRPLVQVASRYETGEKRFLGSSIAAGTAAMASLTQALDTVFAHPNVGPFFCRQLIQRLVTSNPSPAYVQRVVAVFADDGQGRRGQLRAVVRALLLDPEARGTQAASAPGFGKLREPMLRLAGWARASAVRSPSGAWAVGDTSDAGRALGQAPMRAASVFNFFRPGYVLLGQPAGERALLAPEFQITSESSVVGYLNFMQRAVAGTLGDLTPDYSAWIALVETPRALVDDINLVLAAGQLAAGTCELIANAVQSIAVTTDAGRLNRVRAAMLLVLAAPEYLVQN